MKPINEMTDQELAEAVAVEVLGWELDQGKWIQPVGAEFISAPESIAGYFGDRLDLNANFREAIENEIERRGWEMGFWIECFKSGPAYTCRITLAPTHSVHVTRTKSRSRAIAEAVLMAVRGEASKKYDGND